jgi:hypothetical protein
LARFEKQTQQQRSSIVSRFLGGLVRSLPRHGSDSRTSGDRPRAQSAGGQGR